METSKPKLADEVRKVMRRQHYSLRAETTYWDWIKTTKRRLFYDVAYDITSPRNLGNVICDILSTIPWKVWHG